MWARIKLPLPRMEQGQHQIQQKQTGLVVSRVFRCVLTISSRSLCSTTYVGALGLPFKKFAKYCKHALPPPSSPSLDRIPASAVYGLCARKSNCLWRARRCLWQGNISSRWGCAKPSGGILLTKRNVKGRNRSCALPPIISVGNISSKDEPYFDPELYRYQLEPYLGY